MSRGRFDFHRGARDLELHALKVGDGLAELLAFLRVRDRVLQRAARQTDHLRADADAALVERLDRGLVALAHLAENLCFRHAAVLEEQLTRAAGPDAELVFLLADREAGAAALDEKRRDAAIARLGVHGRKDDEEVGFVRRS